jgi:hypothetical protein
LRFYSFVTPGESASHADCAAEYVKCCELHLPAVVPTVKKPRTLPGGVTVKPPVAFWQNVSVFSCPSRPAARVKLVTFPLNVIELDRVVTENVGVAEKATVSELASVACGGWQTSATYPAPYP